MFIEPVDRRCFRKLQLRRFVLPRYIALDIVAGDEAGSVRG
jgi:hypothetical protein